MDRFTATIATSKGRPVTVQHDAYGRVTLSMMPTIVRWFHGSASQTGSDEFLAVGTGLFVTHFGDQHFIPAEEIAKAQAVLREWMAAHPNEY